MTIVQLLTLVMTGLLAGFAGGLFGIGGGVIIVPALYAVLITNAVPPDLSIKMAVATSLATIIVTSFRSVQGHHRHSNVEWALLKSWAPWIGAGAILGAVLARFATAKSLTVFFGIMVMILALQKLTSNGQTKADRDLPNKAIQGGLAGGVGVISSLLGIGGGVIGVLILTQFGRSMHRAVGTAAGFGLAIAIPGSLGYILSGLGHTDGIFGALGFVYLPGFAAIALGTAFAAPIGATAASRLSAVMLNRVFAGYMIITSILMIREGLSL